jgi:hypothetical protein
MHTSDLFELVSIGRLDSIRLMHNSDFFELVSIGRFVRGSSKTCNTQTKTRNKTQTMYVTLMEVAQTHSH